MSVGEVFKLAHSAIGMIASIVFFVIGVNRAYGIWGKDIPDALKTIKRIEAIAYIVLSEVISIHLYVKWIN